MDRYSSQQSGLFELAESVTNGGPWCTHLPIDDLVSVFLKSAVDIASER
jgi:hypothetical protein